MSIVGEFVAAIILISVAVLAHALATAKPGTRMRLAYHLSVPMVLQTLVMTILDDSIGDSALAKATETVLFPFMIYVVPLTAALGMTDETYQALRNNKYPPQVDTKANIHRTLLMGMSGVTLIGAIAMQMAGGTDD